MKRAPLKRAPLKRLVVIADDLTGAAELAGIGFRYGLKTHLFRNSPRDLYDGLTVIDADSRALSTNAAAQKMTEYTASIDVAEFDVIYKKTDSALRGSIVSEIEALMEATGKPAAMLLAQNPSRGRTISGGQYRINDLLLHETAFAHDPDHPAHTAGVLALLGKPAKQSIRFIDAGGEVAQAGITICGASSIADVQQWADRITDDILPAGAADFFQAILEQRELRAARKYVIEPLQGIALFVSGSASAYSKELAQRASQHHMPICAMPSGVFNGSNAAAVDDWREAICGALTERSRALVTIGHPLDRSPGTSERLHAALAEVTARVLKRQEIEHLLVDGGATATAICERMGWQDLAITGELASGVVQMEVPQGNLNRLTVKPGSYPWPEVIWAS